MTETRTIRDPFMGKDVQVSDRLTDRLRGKYANGPTMENGEPEFGWREFPTPPIQHEAASEIECLRAKIENEEFLVWSNQHRAWWRPKSAGYTTDIRGAGLYSRKEAIEISGQSRDGWGNPADLPCELAIPLSALPETIRGYVVAEKFRMLA